MALAFYLVDNPLTKDDPDDLRAETVKRKPKAHTDLIKMVMFRCAGLTESQIHSVLKEYYAVIELFLEEGERVETQHYSIKSSIKGVFNSDDENFDPEKHRTRILLRPNSALKSVAKRIKVEKVDAQDNYPLPQNCVDNKSKTKSKQLTPGGGVKVTGKKLKFNQEDSAQGLFLVDQNGKETKITQIIDLSPSRIVCILPTGLKAGTYTFRVKSDMNTKQVKAGDMKKKLTIG